MSASDLGRIILAAMEQNKDRTAMQFKENEQWKTMTYAQVEQEVMCLACAMVEYGIQPGDRVGIYSGNRYEWTLTDFACILTGAISVPIYGTNTMDQSAYIIENAGIRLIFTGNDIQFEQISGLNIPGLKIIPYDPCKNQTDQDDYLDFNTFKKDITADRNALESRWKVLTPDHTLTIVYTSGTTGNPKGVMLSHANILHQFHALDIHFSVTREDRSLCFLPLSHVYERLWSYYLYSKGAANTYLSDPKQVIETLKEIRPTAMVSVPRLYEKIHGAVMDAQEHASGLKKYLFATALKTGHEYHGLKKEKKKISPGLALKFKILDRLVLSKVRDLVGGPKNFFSAGGAPLEKSIEEFFFACGLLICQGYGLTETSPMISFNTPDAFKFGTVGRPLPGCQVKIGDQGEVMIKGGQVMKGYYNNPEQTAQAMVDGWFKTGDIGEFDPDGFLRITDRIKELIITSGGKNVAPQHIETHVGKDHYIEQIVAVGDRRKFISALVVPATQALENWARKKGLTWHSMEELLLMPEVTAFYRKRINMSSGALARFETIKTFTLLPKPFTVEAGEITPTLKLKRKVISQRYYDLIDAMYRNSSQAGGARVTSY